MSYHDRLRGVEIHPTPKVRYGLHRGWPRRFHHDTALPAVRTSKAVRRRRIALASRIRSAQATFSRDDFARGTVTLPGSQNPRKCPVPCSPKTAGTRRTPKMTIHEAERVLYETGRLR